MDKEVNIPVGWLVAIAVFFTVLGFASGFNSAPTTSIEVNTDLENRLMDQVEEALAMIDSLNVENRKLSNQITDLKISINENKEFIHNATPSQQDSLIAAWLR